MHGFQAYMTFGHSRARYFPPEVGGLIFQGTANVPGVFRIDHDQAYQQTVNLRYQHGKDGLWGTVIWRYDSGLAVTGVPDSAAALLLTPSQQVDIGLACGGLRHARESAPHLRRHCHIHLANPAPGRHRKQRSQPGSRATAQSV